MYTLLTKNIEILTHTSCAGAEPEALRTIPHADMEMMARAKVDVRVSETNREWRMPSLSTSSFARDFALSSIEFEKSFQLESFGFTLLSYAHRRVSITEERAHCHNTDLREAAWRMGLGRRCYTNTSRHVSITFHVWIVGRLSRGYIYLHPSRPSHFLILRWLQPSSRGFP